jgi:predicted RNA-binding Zn-ribbon protein involved in translation (DUF1610 family)
MWSASFFCQTSNGATTWRKQGAESCESGIDHPDTRSPTKHPLRDAGRSPDRLIRFGDLNNRRPAPAAPSRRRGSLSDPPGTKPNRACPESGSPFRARRPIKALAHRSQWRKQFACPFCGSPCSAWQSMDRTSWAYNCPRCGTKGPDGQDAMGAKIAWLTGKAMASQSGH